MKAELIFSKKTLHEFAEEVAEHWPNPFEGTYSQQAEWLCLDYVSRFSYILEASGYFETLEELYYYIQNPNKFVNEYKQFFKACEEFVALLKITEAICNAD